MKRDWVVLSLNRSDKSSKTSCVDWSTQGPDQNKNTFNYKMGAKKSVQLFAVSFLFRWNIIVVFELILSLRFDVESRLDSATCKYEYELPRHRTTFYVSFFQS